MRVAIPVSAVVTDAIAAIAAGSFFSPDHTSSPLTHLPPSTTDGEPLAKMGCEGIKVQV